MSSKYVTSTSRQSFKWTAIFLTTVLRIDSVMATIWLQIFPLNCISEVGLLTYTLDFRYSQKKNSLGSNQDCVCHLSCKSFSEGKCHVTIVETYWMCVTWLHLVEIMFFGCNQESFGVQVTKSYLKSL